MAGWRSESYGLSKDFYPYTATSSSLERCLFQDTRVASAGINLFLRSDKAISPSGKCIVVIKSSIVDLNRVRLLPILVVVSLKRNLIFSLFHFAPTNLVSKVLAVSSRVSLLTLYTRGWRCPCHVIVVVVSRIQPIGCQPGKQFLTMTIPTCALLMSENMIK